MIKQIRPLITVIIPIYNTHKYLKRCIDSVISQKNGDIEVILVDDGSNDGSGELCDEYAERDKRIKVIHKENEGLVRARKTGLQAATGEYISYVDSDDWIDDSLYSDAIKIIEEYHPDYIDYPFYKEFNGGKSVRKTCMNPGFYSNEELMDYLECVLGTNPPFLYTINSSLCSKLIKRVFLARFQYSVPDDLLLGEDFAVSYCLHTYSNNAYYDDRVYYHYCVRGDSMSYDETSGDYDRFLSLGRYLIESIADAQRIYKNYLYYRLYDLMLDCFQVVPEQYMNSRKEFPFFYKVEKGANVVIYGKGIHARNIINVAQREEFFNIVANVDSTDIKEKYQMINDIGYDYILIAIGDHEIASSIKNTLIELGVSERRIKCFDSSYMIEDNLPKEVRINYDR